MTFTKPKLFAATIGKAPPKTAWAIPKMDGPAPGSYETAEAISKTQWRGVESTPKRTDKLVCYVDKHKNLYKHVPGPAHYKDVDNHATVLHKDKVYKKATGHMT